MRLRSAWVVVAGLLVPAAMADLGGSAFRIEAQNEFGSGVIDISTNELTYNPQLDTYSWELAGPREIRSSTGVLLGMLEQAAAAYVVDPVVSLHFLVSTGGAATNFTVTSALLSFATIDPAEGQASAGVTVTDIGGNGATLTGQQPGGKAYGAFYNGLVTNTFVNLVDSVSAPANGTAVGSESFGFSTIGSVSDMSAQWKFNLTGNAAASGTSRYEVRPVPEPASMAVLGLGAAALLRRRRSR